VDKKIRTLKDGEHFGEIALLTKMKRTASVRANEYCTISSMSKHSLLELGEIFPDLLLQFRNGVKQ
jgi:CRP-like cAMP-binding protein